MRQMVSFTLKHAGYEVIEAADGVDALDFARSNSVSLVLTDVNLPRMDGREVLAAIKSDPKLMNIPVVVLTTSEAEQDIVRSYNLHANCFITKPVNFEQFSAVVKAIDNFWLSVVTLPPGGGK